MNSVTPSTPCWPSHHTTFTFHSSLPLAETASTFGEMMLTDQLLAEEKDEAVRRDILFKQVDDAYATIMRQIYFALFEQQAHEMVAEERLGGRARSRLFREPEGAVRRFARIERRVQMGVGLHPAHLPHAVLCVRLCLRSIAGALALQAVQAEGESFKPKYLKILFGGRLGSARARSLREAGIDIGSATFWQGGFDVVDGLVKQLEEL